MRHDAGAHRTWWTTGNGIFARAVPHVPSVPQHEEHVRLGTRLRQHVEDHRGRGPYGNMLVREAPPPSDGSHVPPSIGYAPAHVRAANEAYWSTMMGAKVPTADVVDEADEAYATAVRAEPVDLERAMHEAQLEIAEESMCKTKG